MIRDTKNRLDQQAADFIEKNLKKAYDLKGMSVLAVPGGRSVSGIFSRLAESSLDWSKVYIFMIDERLVSFESSDSNFSLVSELTKPLVASGRLRADNIHPFVFQPAVTDLGLENYKQELEKFGGRYDVILLSAGEDGHVGGLYPNHHSISNQAEFFISMDDSPKPPPERMSSSYKLLSRSEAAVLLFYGEGKRGALANYLNEKMEITNCPAKLVNRLPEMLVLTDLIKI